VVLVHTRSGWRRLVQLTAGDSYMTQSRRP